ncbi:mannos-6-phosphate isomerase [Athelia psychrophila]|uniref:Mannose-6-phosphate isomerase n=1 Tax=Athelia psychrophila TaxID=1759441 RepID=A0A166NXY8_9AGAM|nr:mannos-6-phosphate isomerase [Fibularhizoctonia sp. CBS 109695]
MSSVPQVFAVVPTTQSYDWGKVGSDSKVAQLAAASKVPGFSLEEQKPYAELWMGTHPSSPSHLQSDEALSEYLAAHPELIGDKVNKYYDATNGNLPFLFKVLSIGKALSIQSHPDKQTAEKLHAEQPKIYKDPNHKPEMALAITPFTGLCGFLPLYRISTHLSFTAEFAALIPSSAISQFTEIASSTDSSGPKEKAALKAVFAALMNADEATVKAQLGKLTARLAAGDVHPSETELTDLILSLESQFPGDIGIFCPFMLNFIKLAPGEAMFLSAGEPHAYVSGDMMECMANSDNVIRAGLTPKLRDIPNLISGLTYLAAQPSKHLVQPSTWGPVTTLYDPPVAEFSVLQVQLDSKQEEAHKAIEGPSIAIVTEGEGTVSFEGGDLDVVKGSVFFVAANAEIKIKAGGEKTTVFRAFVEAP